MAVIGSSTLDPDECWSNFDISLHDLFESDFLLNKDEKQFSVSISLKYVF